MDKGQSAAGGLVGYKLDLDNNYQMELLKYRDQCAKAVLDFMRENMNEVQNSPDRETLLNTLNNICTSLRIDTFCLPDVKGLSTEQLQVQLDVRIAEFCTYQRHFSGKVLPIKTLQEYLNKGRPSTSLITVDDIVASITRLSKLSADYRLIPEHVKDRSKQYLSLGGDSITENSQRILQLFAEAKWPYLTVATLKSLSGWSEDVCKEEIYCMQNKGQILVDLQETPHKYYLNLPLSTQFVFPGE